MKPENLPDLLFAALVVMALAFAGSGTHADPDLWGHVRFGQDILAGHAVPRHDPYSFTSDRPWINHEWLAEVLMAGSYGLAGGAGLVALKWLLVVSSFAILWHAVRRAGVFRPVALFLLVVAMAGAYGLMMTVRPHLFSMLFYTILLSLLTGAGRGRVRLLLWMPILFACWANVHGGWLVGLGVLGLWSACASLARSIPWRWAAGGTLLALLGTLATPYGVELWRFLAETVGLSRADITEWQPITTEPYVLIPWWAGTASLMVLAWHRRGRAALPLLVPAAAIGLLAFRVVRLGGFFALTNVMLLAPCFAALGPKRLPLSGRPPRAGMALVAALVLVALVAAGHAVRGSLECVTVGTPGVAESWEPEAEAITFLQRNAFEGRLLCFFNYGEMAIWHLAPKLRVSLDGRRETVYSEAVRDAHWRFYLSDSDASYARFLKADYVWLPRRLPVVTPLEQDGWIALFRGPRSVVLARQAGPHAQSAPWTGPRCFPGP